MAQTLAVLSNELLIATARYVGQTLTLGGETVTATREKEELRITGTGSVLVEEDTYWSHIAIVPETYEGPWFDGSSYGPRTSIVATQVQRWIESTGWLTIAENVPPGDSLVDHLPLLGLNRYRVLSQSAEGSVSIGKEVEVDMTSNTGWMFLNKEEGWEDSVRFRAKGQIDETFTREKVRRKYEGRSKARTSTGAFKTRAFSVAAKLRPVHRYDQEVSGPEAIEAFVDTSQVVCFRSPAGHRHFVTLDTINKSWKSISNTISLSMMEEDFDE